MKNLYYLFLSTLIIVGCSSTNLAQSEQEYVGPPNLIPYTLFHDFETGELFGWETYPHQQDVGYDALFFTRQSPTYNDSKYAIARPVKANDTVELYHGFSRRLDMWTSADTRLQAQVFFQSDRNPEQLEVALGTKDGRLYSHVIENPSANKWVGLDIPLGAFRDENGRSLRAGEHIQVVTLEANYPIVYYLFTYTMLMDDFKLTGERQRRFVAENPTQTNLEKFYLSFLNRHYFYGDTMSLRVRPEGDVPLDRVRGRLLDSSGRVVRDNIAFENRGGAWVNESIRRFQSSDARGRWEIELTGERAGQNDVRWSLEFLVPGEQVSGHPRIFFTRDELDERMARLENNPVASRILENALSDTRFMDVDLDAINEQPDRTAEALTGGPYSDWRVHFGNWNNPMSQLGNVIRAGSFRYAFTGDRAAGEKAKEALLKLAGFEKWNNYWMLGNQFWTYYPVGYALKTVAVGYDMLHDMLTERERAFVREAMMEKGIKMFHRDMVEMNRMPSNNTNHIAVLVSGHAQAAATLYGEDPDNPYLEPYLSGIMTKAKAFIDNTYFEDGSYGEPFSYQAMASRSLSELLDTFERNFGVDFTTTTAFRNFYWYQLHVTTMSGKGHRGFGDGGVALDHVSQVHGQWLVHRTGDPYVYDLVKPVWEAGNGGYMGWLYFRDDIQPISRTTLPTSRVFEYQGMVMRSGWEDDGTIITTRVGPHSNHLHFDQGTFLMITNDEDLLYDAAHGGAYYENLQFPVYNIQAISKNVMLVDHDAESQKQADFHLGIAALSDWPQKVHTFAGEIAAAIESDLATVYKDKLDHYTRTLLYTKRGPLFLFDQVRSVSPEGHIYNWLFHALDLDGEPTIAYEDHRATVDRPRARLTIDVVSPQLASGAIHQSRFDESFVKLNSEEGTREANFLAVLYPEARPSNGNYGARPTTERIESRGWTGARVTLGNQVDYGVFRTSGSGSASVEGFTTDASRFTASFDGSSLVRYYVEGSSFEGHGQSMSAGSPVTLAVAHHSGGTDAEVDASGSTRVSFAVSQRPSRVSLDGSSVRYSYENGRVSLQVPAGRHDIRVR